MPLDIRAFIFDFDGVIADTTELHYRSWQRLADEEGIPFDRQDNKALLGTTRRESLHRLLKGRPIDEATAQAWMTRKNDYFLASLKEFTPASVLPGIVNLLSEARAAGLKTAIASASRNVQPILERLEIADQFVTITDAHSVVNNKPAPDVFIWTAGRLNVSPLQVVIFEDSEAGVTAALRGGFWVVGIGDAEVSRAHIRLPSLAGTHAAQIIAAVADAAGR
ncbi:MAG: beta-phosphoglucomutase [Anaerolineae bacterium]|nr:beta-phosphoglucomutase [Anaerolineae bacterium]